MKQTNRQQNSHKIKSSIYSPLFFQNPGYENNNTPLHLLVIECCRTIYHLNSQTDTVEAIKRINAFIDDVGLDAANAMALTVNDQGDTPIHILLAENADPNNCRLTTQKFDALLTKFIRLMKRKECVPLTEPISLQAVYDNANKILTSKLKQNLLLGTYLTNYTRTVITDSYTHPQFNDYPVSKQFNITNEINALRTKMCSYSNTEYSVDEVDFRNALITDHQFGNCMEHAIIAFAEMRRLNFGIRSEIVYLKNGDHVFLVLDRMKGSNLNNPATWGNNAVICDPWAGEVYPADHLLHHFASLTCLITHATNKRSNLVTSFNLRFHQIRCEFELSAMNINKKTISMMRNACREGGFVYELATSRDRAKESEDATNLHMRPS